MSQQIAIITGAGRGIGRAAAQLLAKAKFKLALVSRTVSEVEETNRLCGGEHLLCPEDVSDPEMVRSAVHKTMEKFGRVDALVHVAGLALSMPVEQMSMQQWQETIDVNLSSAFYFAKALWPIWRRQNAGTMVLVSSEAARDPLLGLAAYGAAKAGLNLFGKGLAREGAEIGVRVHTVAPGATETVMLRSVVTPEQYPPEKALQPSDVAGVIAQCVVGDLRYTSGEVIYVHKTAI